MLIDFKNMEENIVPHMRGGEKEFAVKMFSDGMCKIMHGRLIPGASIGLHTHENDCEAMYILSGKGKALYEGEYLPLSAGDSHYCAKGKAHSLINDSDEDLVFFAVIPVQ